VRIEKRALTDIPHLILQSWKACTQLLDGLLAAEIDSKTGQSSSQLLGVRLSHYVREGMLPGNVDCSRWMEADFPCFALDVPLADARPGQTPWGNAIRPLGVSRSVSLRPGRSRLTSRRYPIVFLQRSSSPSPRST
jgi:hypothetical protein